MHPLVSNQGLERGEFEYGEVEISVDLVPFDLFGSLFFQAEMRGRTRVGMPDIGISPCSAKNLAKPDEVRSPASFKSTICWTRSSTSFF